LDPDQIGAVDEALDEALVALVELDNGAVAFEIGVIGLVPLVEFDSGVVPLVAFWIGVVVFPPMGKIPPAPDDELLEALVELL